MPFITLFTHTTRSNKLRTMGIMQRGACNTGHVRVCACIIDNECCLKQMMCLSTNGERA